MNDSKKLPIELPSMDFEFSIEARGEVSGKLFSGEFKYRIPNLKAKCLAEKKRAELNSGMDTMLDASILQLHYMIAYLRFSLTSTPDWWSGSDYGYNLHDYSVIRTVFERVEAFEQDYMKRVWGDSDEQKV